MLRKVLIISIFVCSIINMAKGQTRDLASSVNAIPTSLQRTPVSQRGTGDGRQRSLVQIVRGLPEGRVFNLQIRDRIPRARSFQASLPNMVPTRMSPSSMVSSRSDLSSVVPSRRDLSSVLPSRRDLNSVVPSRRDVSSVVPSRRDLSSVVPSRRDASSVVPSRRDLSSVLPSRRDASSVVPSRRDLSSVVPSRRDLSSVVPSRRDLSSVVPSRRDLSSVVPSRRDPRLVARSRDLPGRLQETSSAVDGALSVPTISRNAVLSSICPPPRSVRCFSWPRNQDTQRAYVCDGGCRGRTCPIPCECSCVDPRILGRLRATGRISGPELRLIDPRVFDSVRRQQPRGRIFTIRPSAQTGTQSQQETSANSGLRTNELNRSRDTLPDLSFGISDDVLATLIAQPALNEIVGPQGINQILAGEPPPLLSRDNRRQESPPSSVLSNTVTQPNVRNVGTSSVRAQPRADNAAQNQNMGIPVPLSQLNFDPITQIDSTSGLNVGIPVPAPITAENNVSLRHLPGTNVLFVDLSRQSPNAQGLNPAMQSGSAFINNTTANVRSNNPNNVRIQSSNQQTFLDGTATDPFGRPPTMDQCLAQRMELWCDPQKPWDGTPGLPRWCLLNCRADNCDNQRCSCACIDEILFKAKFEQLTLRAP